MSPYDRPHDVAFLVVLVTVIAFAAAVGAVVQSEYDRSDWMPSGWEDTDGDGMNLRHEVLEDTSEIGVATNRNASMVLSGQWTDHYTGETYRWATSLDIDHIVSLAEAHRSGGETWGAERRREFAHDPSNLLPVGASVNRSKGDRDPSEWLPRVNRCWYLEKWIRVKAKWSLTYDTDEAHAILTGLARCLQR